MDDVENVHIVIQQDIRSKLGFSSSHVWGLLTGNEYKSSASDVKRQNERDLCGSFWHELKGTDGVGVHKVGFFHVVSLLFAPVVPLMAYIPLITNNPFIFNSIVPFQVQEVCDRLLHSISVTNNYVNNINKKEF